MSRRYLPGRTRSTLVVAIILLLLMIGGVGIGRAIWNGPATASQAEPQYPGAWLSGDLPEIPGEIIASSETGETGFEIEAPLTPDQLGDLLESEFENRDWQFYETADDEAYYENEFFNETSEVIVQARPSACGKSRVRVTLRQYIPQPPTPPAGLTSSAVIAIE